MTSKILLVKMNNVKRIFFRIVKFSPKVGSSDCAKRKHLNTFIKKHHNNGAIKLLKRFITKPKVLNESLLKACECNNLVIVKWLLENTTADINFSIISTPLTIACYHGHFEMVKYLVGRNNIDVNKTDKADLTPLAIACDRVKHKVALHLLLLEANKEVNIDIADKDCNSLLHVVIWNNEPSDWPLHKACRNNDISEVVQILYSDFIDLFSIDAQNNEGETPLHLACQYNHRQVIEMLVLKGADPTIKNGRNLTPEQLAAERNDFDNISEILNINALCDKMHQTALLKQFAISKLVIFFIISLQKSVNQNKLIHLKEIAPTKLLQTFEEAGHA